MNNKIGNVHITLHLLSLISCIAHKYKHLKLLEQFLQSACIFLQEVYLQEVDDTQITKAYLDTHTCN